MRTAVIFLLAAMLLAAAQAYAQGWSDFATVSMTDPATPKLSANRLCYSDGRDVACDGAAGLLSTSGSLVISTVAAGGLSVSGNTSLTAVSATNVSATGNVSAVKFIGDGSLLTGISGGGSSSATTEVSFHVDKNGASQTLATNAFAKLTWPREVYDTNSNFASDRFTPTVAGKYLFIAQMGSNGANDCMLALYKNGSAATYSGENVLGPYDTSGQPVCRTVMMLDMNGSTDYVEVYGEIPGAITPSLTGATTRTFFQGSLLGPGQTSSGGGGSSSAGDRIVSTSANIVAYAGGTISLTTGGTSGTAYFSSTGLLVAPGISATQNVSSFTTLYASDKVGIGTSSPVYPLEVSGTGIRATASNSGYSMLQPGSWAATGFVGFYTSATTRLGYVGWGILNSTLSLVTDASTTSLSLGTSGTTHMLINGSGNVGVGTMSPNAKLEVAGTVSASALSVPGTSCGLRQVAGYCINASTPRYYGANIPCNGTTITATCTYNSEALLYYHSGATCPSGYTGVLLTSFIPEAYAAGYGAGYSLQCIKN